MVKWLALLFCDQEMLSVIPAALWSWPWQPFIFWHLSPHMPKWTTNISKRLSLTNSAAVDDERLRWDHSAHTGDTKRPRKFDLNRLTSTSQPCWARPNFTFPSILLWPWPGLEFPFLQSMMAPLLWPLMWVISKVCLIKSHDDKSRHQKSYCKKSKNKK